MKRRTKQRRILLVIPMDFESGRGILRGIRNYAGGRSDWSLQLRVPVMPFRLLADESVDGVIAHLHLRRMVAPILRLGRPVVNVSNTIGESLKLPRVGSDEEQIGRLAAEHFLERGFRHFAFFGYSQVTHSRARGAAFRARLAEAGFSCEAIWKSNPNHLVSGIPFVKEDTRILPWLRSLPKPVAVLAATARIGFEILEICREEHIPVPHEVAVLTVDDDDVLCGLATPPLSAVRAEYERIGAEAAALLERLMAGEAPPSAPILIPPDRVIVRQSTDVLAVHDAALEKTMRFIRDNIHRPIRGADLAACAGLSRRMLERRFRTAFGLAPLQEVRRFRVDRARQLLAETHLPMPLIAERCGFATPQLFANVFRRQTGQSPTRYRREYSSAGQR
jgi:LacI family transcriptional regulator